LLPSLRIGFFLDDHIYQFALELPSEERSPSTNLFRFVSGDDLETAELAREGYLPWWIYDKLKIVFWRPFSELLIRIDYALFGDLAWPYHVHSLAWWLGTLLAAGLLLRKILPGPVWLLAFLLFALDESHMFPAAWISNRNALVAVLPAFLGLWAYLRWRMEGWRVGRYLAFAGFAVGLLGGETALSVFVYLLAYEMWGNAGAWRERFRALVPMAGLLGCYIVAHHLSGAGASGSGVYIDPVNDPAAFAKALPSRMFPLLAGAILGLSADFTLLAPALVPVFILAGCVGVIFLYLLLRSAWPALEPGVQVGLRWMLPGSILALLPVAATFPSDRLSLAAALGLSGGLAAVLAYAWRTFRNEGRRWHVIAAGSFFAIVHLLLAPLLLLNYQAVIVDQSQKSTELTRYFDKGSPAGSEPEAIVLAAPDHIVAIYLPFMLRNRGSFPFSSMRPLSLAPYNHRITSDGSRTIELEIVDGSMMGTLFEMLYRGSKHPLSPGVILDRGLFRAEILEASSAGPTCVAFHFDRDLSDPSLHFLAWEDGELRTLTLPAAGDTLLLERQPGPTGF
jgi:hypothetical protein